MFAKLLKYEFRSIKRALMVPSIIILLSSALGYFLMLLVRNSSNSGNGAKFILPFIMFIFSIILLFLVYYIGSSIYLYIHFYKTKFTDQGYLTFTLPATTHQILLSSILNFIIWNIIISIIMILGITLFFAPAYTDIYDTVSFISAFFPTNEFVTPLSIISTITQLIGNLCYSIILPFLSLTIGSLIAKKHKFLAAFGIGYGISFGYNMLTTYLSIMLTSDEASLESALQANYQYNTVIGLITILLSVGGYFIMHHIISKKLNI